MKLFTKTIAILSIAILSGVGVAKAQEFNVQGDLVSSYVWRGMYQSGAAVQPTLGFSVAGFSLTAWGSVDFNGEGKKEADLTAAYSIAGLTVSLTDYWWAGQSYSRLDENGEPLFQNGLNKYFQFDNHITSHIVEAGLSYTLPVEKFPLSISAYTMVWGADKKVNDKGEIKNAYSTYAELNYPFSLKGVNLNAIVGASLLDSPANYYNDGFAVTNISLKASKDIQITEKFSLPIYTQVIWNPNREDVHFVFGITLR